MYLQSKDLFDLIIRFDIDKGVLERISKNNQGFSDRLNGSFSEYDDTFFVIFVENDRLFFCYNNKKIDLLDSYVINVEGTPNNRKMTILKDGKKYDEVEYSLGVLDNKYENDITAFIEDEDFDFGLFVSNLSRNKERKKVLLEYYKT